MTLYIDDMYRYPMGKFGRMLMSHMITDQLNDTELHEMAARVGIKRQWYQWTSNERGGHYDVCMSRRQMAISYGVKSVTMKELGHIIKDKKARLEKAHKEFVEKYGEIGKH